MTQKKRLSARSRITAAFMELMTEKSYMDITVTDVVRRAQVARASFYRSFSSTSDIVDLIVEEICAELAEKIIPTASSNSVRRWREFLLEHFLRFKSLSSSSVTIGFMNMSLIFSRMDSRIKLLESSTPPTDLREKYLATGKMGLINGITKKWIDTGAKESPEEMVDFIASFIYF